MKVVLLTPVNLERVQLQPWNYPHLDRERNVNGLIPPPPPGPPGVGLQEPKLGPLFTIAPNESTCKGTRSWFSVRKTPESLPSMEPRNRRPSFPDSLGQEIDTQMTGKTYLISRCHGIQLASLSFLYIIINFCCIGLACIRALIPTAFMKPEKEKSRRRNVNAAATNENQARTHEEECADRISQEAVNEGQLREGKKEKAQTKLCSYASLSPQSADCRATSRTSQVVLCVAEVNSKSRRNFCSVLLCFAVLALLLECSLRSPHSNLSPYIIVGYHLLPCCPTQPVLLSEWEPRSPWSATGPLLTGNCLVRKQMTPGPPGDKGYQELAQSIDRSRKRNLEEGLLRGDLVRDRQRIQEDSASPHLKRPRSTSEVSPTGPAAAMAMTMAEFREYMENNTNKRLDGLDDKMSGMQGTIRRIDANVKTNADNIQKHEEKISEMFAQIQKIKEDPFPPLAAGATGSLGGGLLPPVPSRVEDREFDLARRSLRLWPVPGSTKDSLWEAAGIFLGTNLGMEGKLNATSIESITRVEIPSGPGVRDEVLVRFKEITLRDMVMGAASKLSSFIDVNGKATAGMRMEVPSRLQQSFRVLFKYGQNLRARHGQGTRRHVKFCDLERNLFLNIKLPGDEGWSKVSLEVAMRGMRARETMSNGQLERRLDITGPFTSQPRPRASSTAGPSGPPPPTQASAWTRRSGGSSSS